MNQTALEILSSQHTQLVVGAEELRTIIVEEIQNAYINGLTEGLKRAKEAAVLEQQPPVKMEKAAEMLGMSISKLKKERKDGNIEVLNYGDCVRVEIAEIIRYKRTHRSLDKACGM